MDIKAIQTGSEPKKKTIRELIKCSPVPSLSFPAFYTDELEGKHWEQG